MKESPKGSVGKGEVSSDAGRQRYSLRNTQMATHESEHLRISTQDIKDKKLTLPQALNSSIFNNGANKILSDP